MENPEEQSSSSMPSNKSAVFSKRKGGRKKFQETRHPVYKGVRRRNGKWVCELWELNKKSRIWLGTFSSPEMAARAYDAAALASRGDSAALNFPEVACELPRARSDDIRDIKYAAMEAEAKSFSSSSSSCLSSSSSCMEISTSEKVQESSRKVFVDEEEVFNMPGILDSMAEALILTPLAMKNGFKWDDFEETEEFTLWSD